MDKLYTKKALIAKVAYCAVLPLLPLIFTGGTDVDPLLWLFFSLVGIGCLYTVPFWLSLHALRRNPVSGVARFVVTDISSCLVPATCSSLLYELYVELFVQSSLQNGLSTLLIFVIFLLISGIFWLLYKFVGKHSRP